MAQGGGGGGLWTDGSFWGLAMSCHSPWGPAFFLLALPETSFPSAPLAYTVHLLELTDRDQ